MSPGSTHTTGRGQDRTSVLPTSADSPGRDHQAALILTAQLTCYIKMLRAHGSILARARSSSSVVYAAAVKPPTGSAASKVSTTSRLTPSKTATTPKKAPATPAPAPAAAQPAAKPVAKPAVVQVVKPASVLPKKAPSAYNLFCKEFISELPKREGPKVDGAPTSLKLAADKWKALSEADKKRYNDKAAALKGEWEKTK